MSRPAVHSEPAERVPPQDTFWTKIPGTTTAIRRGYPRVHANVPVRVGGTPGGIVKVHTNDLSLGGLQIGCNRAIAQKLRPDDPAGTRNPTYAISLLLDVDGLALQVNAHARLLHMSLIPEEAPDSEIAVGMKFVDFEEGGKETLIRFIEYHMCPAGL